MLFRAREEELDEVRLQLTPSQKVWAVLGALALIAEAIGSCAQGVVTYHDWACREGLPALTCPTEQVEEQPEGA